jgi:hypothetical protein
MSNQQAYRDVLSRLEKKDKQPMTSKEVYDALSFLPGTGDVIGAYEAPAIISAGIEKMGEDDLVEKAKGVGIASLGAIGVLPVVGGPARKLAKVFSKIDTPVYHFTQNAGDFTKFDIDRVKDPFSSLGVHVGSNPKSAQDRFVALNYAGPVNINYRQGMPLPEAIAKAKKEGYGERISTLDAPKKPGSVPLKADLSKPFLNPKTNKPFTEGELFRFIEDKGMKFSKEGDRNIKGAVELRKELAEKGFTHVPYVNDYEDVKELSYIMLVDRPKGSTKVLQSPFAKKDPAAADDADFMKADGGVVEMKDKAVNMYRGKQGIEPFIKYMV